MPKSKVTVEERVAPQCSIEGHVIYISMANGTKYAIYVSDESDFIDIVAMQGGLNIKPRAHDKIGISTE